MVSVFLFIIAIAFTLGRLIPKQKIAPTAPMEVLLSYVLFFNMGLFSLIAAYMHLFMGPETARMIGWEPGSPFQFEIGIANLSYGILGVVAYWIRGRFWDAASLGWSILLLGCFVGHLIDYSTRGNDAPWNIGVFIWFNDLFLPLFVLGALSYLRNKQRKER